MSEKLIFGVVRWTPASGWYVQNDTDHQSSGIAGVELLPNGKLRINYNFTAGKVGAIALHPDNALLALGFGPGGAEVGLGAADFQLSRATDISGAALFYNGQWYVNYPSQPGMTIEQMAASHIRVHHPAVSPDVMPPQLSRRVTAVGASVGLFGADFFDIHFDAGTDRKEALFRRAGAGIWPAAMGYPNYAGGNYFLMGVMHV